VFTTNVCEHTFVMENKGRRVQVVPVPCLCSWLGLVWRCSSRPVISACFLTVLITLSAQTIQWINATLRELEAEERRKVLYLPTCLFLAHSG
jgi:hypothetical protein